MFGRTERNKTIQDVRQQTKEIMKWNVYYCVYLTDNKTKHARVSRVGPSGPGLNSNTP
jgi:hypothetical protein